MRIDWEPPAAVKLAMVLFAVGLVILVSPVMSKETYGGKFIAAGDDGNEVCGLTIIEAFVALSEVGGEPSDFQIDCTVKARRRVGFGVLFVLVSLPPAFVSLLRARESDSEDAPPEAPEPSALPHL